MSAQPKTVYFAHSMRDYKTLRAASAKATIARLRPPPLFKILDPEQLNWAWLVLKHGSHEAVYDHVIASSDVVVALEHREHVGRGVFEELERALEAAKPCYALRGDRLVPIDRVVIADENDWKVRYGRIEVPSLARSSAPPPLREADPARVLVADPPWSLDDKLGKRGAEANYACLSLDELKAFPLPPLADDCVLFLWRLSSMVEEAYEVVRAWGFVPKTEIVWNKRTKTDKDHFGLGYYVRAAHETCIIAVKGKPKIKSHSIRSTFAAPTGRHSEKPEMFFVTVEHLYDGPYVELFSRRRRANWANLGNEVGVLDG